MAAGYKGLQRLSAAEIKQVISLVRNLLQDTQARKSLAFQEFQRGTASGGNVGESCLIEA